MEISTDSLVRFGELSVKGFRRLSDIKLALHPLSVLIGANGTGKTSVLDALSLLANSAQAKLSSCVSDLSGLSSFLTYDKAEHLTLGISMVLSSDERLEYTLKLSPRGVAYTVEEEILSQQRGMEPFLHIVSHGPDIRYFEGEQRRLVRPTWDHSPLETSLSQVPKMFKEPEDFRKRLASSTYYHVLQVEGRSPVRLPQPIQPSLLPGQNGEELVPCLFYLRETHRDRFEAVEDALRAAFPRFERLEFPPVAAGTLALAWRESGYSKPLYMHQLSEGTLRFLWLTTLLQSPGLTAMTLLDEPEVSLHPELLNILADLLREASARTQIIVATHSDALIRFMEPSEVVVMDSAEDGTTTIQRADQLNLDEWLKEYSLAELWRTGRIGARAL
jgi:predicted ATPase